jgi:hypothetical protein
MESRFKVALPGLGLAPARIGKLGLNHRLRLGLRGELPLLLVVPVLLDQLLKFAP